MWKLSKWARSSAIQPPPLPQIPALQDSKGNLHKEFDSKVQVLREQFFPPPTRADLSDILPTNRYPPPLSIEASITAEQIASTIAGLPPDKAPGPDKIPNRFLKQCSSTLTPLLATLFTACIQKKYHPVAFKESTTVVIRKPQQASYNVPKSYRPIALLNTIRKVLEKIIARRISQAAEEHGLLPHAQMGARTGRSSLTALELITKQLHTVWKQKPKLVGSLLALDISGAFDQVSHPRLLDNLRKKGIPLWLISYIASFLNTELQLYPLTTKSHLRNQQVQAYPRAPHCLLSCFCSLSLISFPF